LKLRKGKNKTIEGNKKRKRKRRKELKKRRNKRTQSRINTFIKVYQTAKVSVREKIILRVEK